MGREAGRQERKESLNSQQTWFSIWTSKNGGRGRRRRSRGAQRGMGKGERGRMN